MTVRELQNCLIKEINGLPLDSFIFDNPAFSQIIADVCTSTDTQGVWLDDAPVTKIIRDRGVIYRWNCPTNGLNATLNIFFETPQNIIIIVSGKRQINTDFGTVTQTTCFNGQEIRLEKASLRVSSYVPITNVERSSCFDFKTSDDLYNEFGVMFNHVIRTHEKVFTKLHERDKSFFDFLKKYSNGHRDDFVDRAECKRLAVHCFELVYKSNRYDDEGLYTGVVPFSRYWLENVPAYDMRLKGIDLPGSYRALIPLERDLAWPLKKECYNSFYAKINELEDERQVGYLLGLLSQTCYLTYDRNCDPDHMNTLKTDPILTRNNT